MHKSSHYLQHCAECGELTQVPQLSPFTRALCPRCHHVLARGEKVGWSLRRCALMALAIVFLLPFVLTQSLMRIDLLGVPIEVSLWSGIWKMATAGYSLTAFLILICAVVMPVSFVALILVLRLQQVFHRRARYSLIVLTKLKQWVMLDVYLLALGVAAFKVREYAELTFDFSVLALVLSTLLCVVLFVRLEPRRYWAEFYPEYHLLKPESTAAQSCHQCEYTFNERILDQHCRERCPRCEARLQVDAKVEAQKVWAALIAGAIMLVPANVLPISSMNLAGAVSADTLFSGVLSFIGMGSYFVAAVVFIASIFVPLSKLAALVYLLLAVHFRWQHNIERQMKVLHYVHFVGRWSMLDLFVLALMMSLVERGQLLSFSVGDAAFYFGASVFLTMIAAHYFDSRWLWQIHESHQAQKANQPK